MNPDLQQQLAQLADIHPAAPPSAGPPAPGWWLLAGLLLLLAVLLVRKILARRAVQRRRRAWLDELEALRGRHDPAARPRDYLSELNRLFRAVALQAFPESPCARLAGAAWVAFVRERMPAEEPGDAQTDALAVLARGPYEPAPDFDTDRLERLARRWVVSHG